MTNFFDPKIGLDVLRSSRPIGNDIGNFSGQQSVAAVGQLESLVEGRNKRLQQLENREADRLAEIEKEKQQRLKFSTAQTMKLIDDFTGQRLDNATQKREYDLLLKKYDVNEGMLKKIMSGDRNDLIEGQTKFREMHADPLFLGIIREQATADSWFKGAEKLRSGANGDRMYALAQEEYSKYTNSGIDGSPEFRANQLSLSKYQPIDILAFLNKAADSVNPQKTESSGRDELHTFNVTTTTRTPDQIQGSIDSSVASNDAARTNMLAAGMLNPDGSYTPEGTVIIEQVKANKALNNVTKSDVKRVVGLGSGKSSSGRSSGSPSERKFAKRRQLLVDELERVGWTGISPASIDNIARQGFFEVKKGQINAGANAGSMTVVTPEGARPPKGVDLNFIGRSDGSEPAPTKKTTKAKKKAKPKSSGKDDMQSIFDEIDNK